MSQWTLKLLLVSLVGGSLWRLPAQAPVNPAIVAPTITPNVLTVNTPTDLVVTVPIPDPTLNPSTVQLLRVNTKGTSSVIAEMKDNGQRGDEKPGDKTFTASIRLTESQVGVLSFQVSGTFRGTNRVPSSFQQIAVVAPHVLPINLPQDPGEAGKTTIQGIDSDADGVRDDVQRYIIFSHPESEALRLSLLAISKTLQTATVFRTPLSLSTIECLHYVSRLTGIAASHSLYLSLREQQLNTYERFITYFANRPRSLTYVVPADLSTSCTFNALGMN